MKQILKYLPQAIQQLILETIRQNPQTNIEENAIEIKIRIGRPVIIKLRNLDIIIKYQITENELMHTLEKICENSIYAYKNQICQGFITIFGGHRVGLTGTCVVEDGKIINIKYISGLNFRIAREVKGCSKHILKEIINIQNNTIYNTLIVSPPGKGKTTMLRDVIRTISDGIPEIKFRGKNCGVVDERGEIASMYKGRPQNDIGIRTDIIENVSKAQGMQMLIRSMGPEVIACDEIGTQEDVQAIKYAVCSGVKGIFTMHGAEMKDVRANKDICELIDNKWIEKIIFLD